MSQLEIDTSPPLETSYKPLLVAQTALVKAQRAGQELDNDLADSLAGTARIAYAKEQRRETWERAGENFHRIAHLTQEIDADAVGIWIDALSRWDRIDREAERLSGTGPQRYSLVLCSPGGDIVPGMKFYSFLKGLTERRPVDIAASGLCASMATVIHQAGSRRIIEPACSYLIHEASGSVGGRTDKMVDQMGWLAALNTQMREFLTERAKIDADELLKRMDRRELWLMPKEALELGFCDEIGYLQ